MCVSVRVNVRIRVNVRVRACVGVRMHGQAEILGKPATSRAAQLVRYIGIYHLTLFIMQKICGAPLSRGPKSAQ